eukprot:996851-Amphidinium_carterae.1
MLIPACTDSTEACLCHSVRRRVGSCHVGLCEQLTVYASATYGCEIVRVPWATPFWTSCQAFHRAVKA